MCGNLVYVDVAGEGDAAALLLYQVFYALADVDCLDSGFYLGLYLLADLGGYLASLNVLLLRLHSGSAIL